MTNSFFLIGPPGVGKTTIGRLFAQKIKADFIDCDKWIEKDAALTISSLFFVLGELGFRQVETDTIDCLSKQRNVVLSTGGGVILNPLNRTRMLERGIVVFLDLEPEQIFDRIKYDPNRPLLQTEDPLESLRSIYNSRIELYLEAAHYRINTENRSANEVSDLLIELQHNPVDFTSDWCHFLKR